jgi:broad specificity phosphatase PhoE
MSAVTPEHTRVLLWVRHGETDDNARKVFQGHGGGPLNDLGRKQADAIGERLKGLAIRKIIASDVVRTRETAAAIARFHERTPFEVDARLREVDVGAWQGLGQAEIEQEFPDEWKAWREGIDVRRGGGETYKETAVRAIAALEAHAAEAGVYVLVSHAGTIRGTVAEVMSVAIDQFAPVQNTALTALQSLADSKRFRLLLWNDVTHLNLRDPVQFLPQRE